jgi:hypothetical protein
LAGAVSSALRRSARDEYAQVSGPVTMTFNSMARLPGLEHVPWSDPAAAQYFTMSYPAGANGLSIAAVAIEGRVIFSASFDPGVFDKGAVLAALEQLHDMPALLSPASLNIADPFEEKISTSTLHAYASRNGS